MNNPFAVFLRRLRLWSQDQSLIKSQVTAHSVLLGKILGALQGGRVLNRLSDAEFKVFSQFGDDGIIHYLINTIPITNTRFIEFGVENYTEANTRFLLINNNWSGLVLDGTAKNIMSIHQDDIYWRHNVQAVTAFITQENINEVLKSNGYEGEIGLLSIDIDGNDYWVWKAITVVNPILVIVEYNSIFGEKRPVTVPYRADFQRSAAHSSNMYWGAALPALCQIAEEKGYFFVGSNSAGNNAYFIRKDKIGPMRPLSAQEGYVLSQFRDSRNEQGELTFVSGEQRSLLIKGLPVFNVVTQELETL